MLQNCTSLTSVVLNFRPAKISTYGNALRGLNRGCTVQVPQSADKAEYDKTVDYIYRGMCANAGVKLRWIGSRSAMTTPTASSGIVTLTGSDASKYTDFL